MAEIDRLLTAKPAPKLPTFTDEQIAEFLRQSARSSAMRWRENFVLIVTSSCCIRWDSTGYQGRTRWLVGLPFNSALRYANKSKYSRSRCIALSSTAMFVLTARR
jgi:hypothetical protein